MGGLGGVLFCNLYILVCFFGSGRLPLLVSRFRTPSLASVSCWSLYCSSSFAIFWPDTIAIRPSLMMNKFQVSLTSSPPVCYPASTFLLPLHISDAFTPVKARRLLMARFFRLDLVVIVTIEPEVFAVLAHVQVGDRTLEYKEC